MADRRYDNTNWNPKKKRRTGSWYDMQACLVSPLYSPSRGTGFVCDPTPGRHTAAPMSRIDADSADIAPYPELQFQNVGRYEYKNKGSASMTVSCYWQVGTCAGVCYYPVIFFGNFRLIEFINSVTGWDMDIHEALKTGARIQTLRQCFNLREGIKPSDIKLPKRMIGIPPKMEGPLKGVTIDIESLRKEFYKKMGFDVNSGEPTKSTLKDLELDKIVTAE